MPSLVFGRTNRSLPDTWLRLTAGQTADQTKELAQAAEATGTVLDISAGPAILGGFLRGTESPLMQLGGRDVESAADEAGAGNRVEAHLIETLSAVGRETLDFYFLTVRQAWEEVQIQGALAALEMARQEGLVLHVGLYAQGSPLSALGLWQFNDAFEALLVPNQPEFLDTLGPLATQRRVGVIVEGQAPQGAVSLLRVTSAEDVHRAFPLARNP